MSDYFVFVGIAIFIVPIAVMGLVAGRISDSEYQRRKKEGWYI
jgi:hypothetical protein